jgi:cAMP-specific phosphodiesterase 4
MMGGLTVANGAPMSISLSRATTEPTTSEELGSMTGKEARLHSLAVLRNLALSSRPGVGSIVTSDELKLLERTVAAAAELNDIKTLAGDSSGNHTAPSLETALASQREGEDGYLLDEEMYNSLRMYTSVKVVKPVDKLKRAVRSMKTFAMKARHGDTSDSPTPSDDIMIETLPEFVEAGVTRWSGDIFEIDKLATQGSLVWVTEYLFQKCGLVKALEVPTVALRGWLVALNGEYLANSYHNSMHGADVFQTLWCLIENQGHVNHTKLAISNKMKFAALLSAAAHDVGHGGFNNNWLINTEDPLAIRYLYEAPLEHMHSAKAFELMRLPGCDVLSFFDGENLKDVRKMMVAFILGTAMEGHFGHLADLNKKLDTVGIHLDNNNDAVLVVTMMLHAADISNPAKNWDYYNLWTDRVMEEFYIQGDKEKELGMRVSDGYDRTNPTPAAKFQNGFIAFIVKPLYSALDKLPFLDMKVPLEHIDDNLMHWKRVAERRKSKPLDSLKEATEAVAAETK